MLEADLQGQYSSIGVIGEEASEEAYGDLPG